MLIATIALLGYVYPTGLAAQSKPSGKKASFDIRRFSPTPAGTFETFYVTATQPLKEAMEAGTLKEDTRVLVTETAAGRLALLTDQMAFHHLAEGNAGGKDWMVSF
jgi:hypothetical protein